MNIQNHVLVSGVVVDAYEFDDVIEVKLELTDNIRNLLDLLLKQNFILDWYVTDPEIIYEL